MIRYDNTDHKNDVTRIGWQDLIKDKLDKNDGYKRLESNILVNKRESYDDSNKLINSLNEEILLLKRKMKFVYEKDEEIQKLKNNIKILEKENINSDNRYKTENIALKLTLSSLEEKNREYLKKIDELIFNENKKDNDYKEENEKLNKDNSLLKRELNILKKKNLVDEDVTDIDFDIDVKIKEKVKVDIQKLKRIISKKLENRRDYKVNQLLKEYNIIDKKEIDKDIIEKFIKEII